MFWLRRKLWENEIVGGGIQVDFMVVLEQNHSVDAKDFSHICNSGRIGNSRVGGHLSFCGKRGLGKLSIQLLCKFYIAARLELF